MNSQTKSTRLATVPFIYDLQTDLFKRSLEGISDEDAHARLDTPANHIAWLTGSLVQQRHYLAAMLDPGNSYKQKADALFSKNQGIRSEEIYPPLSEFIADWDKISPVTRNLLLKAEDELLDKKLDMGEISFPIFDMITFTLYREANIIGQIALWRRLLNYPPMNYM